MTKPKTADEYTPRQLQAVRGACYDLVSTVGDVVQHLVIVGGLVPSLLVEPARTSGDAHVGTVDLDLGLQVGLLREAHYHRLASRLRDSGFEPATDDAGEPIRYRWVSRPRNAQVDFLVAQRSLAKGSLTVVDKDLEAIATPGLHLAFEDREWVQVGEGWPGTSGPWPELPVCGPAAFVVLKALAFHDRRENKDAYDIDYVLRHYGASVEMIAARLRPLREDAVAQVAIGYLQEDFAQLDSIGPSRAAAFLGRAEDEGFRADVAGLVERLLQGF